jgi:hypothetical protein
MLSLRRFASVVGLVSVALITVLPAPLLAEDATAPSRPEPPGLGEPGNLTQIAFELGAAPEASLVLVGSEARRQLVVTGTYDSGQARDLTRDVQYETTPEGVVRVESNGQVVPLANGEATVTARTAAGQSASVSVKVERHGEVIPVNFPNQVVPIFTKLGCNSGGCHGKASGQNGFKLSLLGFYPNEDYEFLVKEGRGRRLFPAAPDKSLLLQKASNGVPHGGGMRLEAGSYEYRLIREWIAQGMPFGKPEDPTVARIEVYPRERRMARKGSQQIAVLAHYTDGRIEDVTRMAQYDANDQEMAESDKLGLVKTLGHTGDVAVMARYQGQVDVFRASIPLGVAVDSLPPERNAIDQLVFAKLKGLGIPPSNICDDSTFLRRTSIDIAGRLPTMEETRRFLADPDPAKRDKWIEDLLAGESYADLFANKWSAILRNKRRNNTDNRGTYAFHGWIRDALDNNMPYDQFVREIVGASGELGNNPPVVWYREVKTSEQQVEDTAQLFLGLRIQCARCHHHPFEQWSQRDYYGFAAFFSQVGTKPGLQTNEPRIYHRRGAAGAVNPRSGERLAPTGLGSQPLAVPADDDPRHKLADWLADPSNPFFAKALVNRYWKHFFGRGIVDPEDDMRVTNPPSNPELLDALAKGFIESGYDLKQLVRTICQSTTYQLSAEPNDYNLTDKQNYSRYYPKRLAAEVLLDSVNRVTATTTSFNGMPSEMLAVQLPDQAVNSYFLTVFGKPQADTACECERSQEANLAQSLHLLNSSEIQQKLAGGRPALLAREKERADEDKIRELYLCAFSREPAADELAIAMKHIEKRGENKQIAYEDILWALINTKEFLFNH